MCFFYISYKSKKSVKHLLIQKSCLVADVFNLAEDAEEDGGTIWDHLKIILRSFKTILGPPMQTNMFFNPKQVSLKWHILTSSPLLE